MSVYLTQSMCLLKMELLFDDRSGGAIDAGTEDMMAEVFRLGLNAASAPSEAEISLSIVDKDEIRALNNEYRGRDTVTDVLSFPFYEPPLPKNIRPLALGDIVICWEAAAAQAEEYGHSIKREMAFLGVHGLLHLLGYDHETPADEQVMTAMQEKILSEAGISR